MVSILLIKKKMRCYIRDRKKKLCLKLFKAFNSHANIFCNIGAGNHIAQNEVQWIYIVQMVIPVSQNGIFALICIKYGVDLCFVMIHYACVDVMLSCKDFFLIYRFFCFRIFFLLSVFWSNDVAWFIHYFTTVKLVNFDQIIY